MTTRLLVGMLTPAIRAMKYILPAPRGAAWLPDPISSRCIPKRTITASANERRRKPVVRNAARLGRARRCQACATHVQAEYRDVRIGIPSGSRIVATSPGTLSRQLERPAVEPRHRLDQRKPQPRAGQAARRIEPAEPAQRLGAIAAARCPGRDRRPTCRSRPPLAPAAARSPRRRAMSQRIVDQIGDRLATAIRGGVAAAGASARSPVEARCPRPPPRGRTVRRSRRSARPGSSRRAARARSPPSG